MLSVVHEPFEVAGHAFISYVREDSIRIDQLQHSLEAAGIPVWRDKVNLWPGEDWRAEIRQAITDDALVFIACFSRNSLSRHRSYQNEELVLAIEQLRLRQPDQPWLIPVRLDECEIPDRDIGGGRTLGSIQRVDLFGDASGEEDRRLVAAVLRLLRCNPHITTATDEALARVTRTVARTDPARAERMARSVTNPEWLVHIAEAMTGTDPARAVMTARNTTDDADRAEALARIARASARADRTDPASSRLLLAEAEQIARNLPAHDARQAAYALASIAATWLDM